MTQLIATQYSPRPMQEAVSVTQQVSAPPFVMPEKLPPAPKLPEEFEFIQSSDEVMKS